MKLYNMHNLQRSQCPQTFVHTIQVVAPKKAKLAAAEAEFKELQTALAAKKAMLQEVQAKLQKLQEKLDIMEGKKALLEAEVNNCQKVHVQTFL